MDLPVFKYHPNPVATGSFEACDAHCGCCGEARGYLYRASFYCAGEHPDLCPWCIADGAAANKWNGMFSDSCPLSEADVPASIIEEVCQRTPGYSSWQQERWETHCGEACAFYGDAPVAEVKALCGEALDDFLRREGLDETVWSMIQRHYQPGGSPCIFKFVCLHCDTVIFQVDGT